MSELNKMGLAEARDALRAGDTSSVELTDACLTAINSESGSVGGPHSEYCRSTPVGPFTSMWAPASYGPRVPPPSRTRRSDRTLGVSSTICETTTLTLDPAFPNSCRVRRWRPNKHR